MSKDATISKVYYDLERGFCSIAKTLAEARKVDESIKREDVKSFLDKQELRQTKKRRSDNSFIPFAPLEEFQFDLADWRRRRDVSIRLRRHRQLLKEADGGAHRAQEARGLR